MNGVETPEKEAIVAKNNANVFSDAAVLLGRTVNRSEGVSEAEALAIREYIKNTTSPVECKGKTLFVRAAGTKEEVAISFIRRSTDDVVVHASATYLVWEVYICEGLFLLKDDAVDRLRDRNRRYEGGRSPLPGSVNEAIERWNIAQREARRADETLDSWCCQERSEMKDLWTKVHEKLLKDETNYGLALAGILQDTYRRSHQK